MIRLVAALVASLSLTTASAQANSIAVSVHPDPVAGVEFPIAAIWSVATAPSGFVGVTVKPTGAGCAPNFNMDFKWAHTPVGTGDDVIMTEAMTGNETGVHMEAAPGSYTICAYLQNSEDSKVPDAMTGPVLFNIRAANAAPAPAPPPDPCPAARVALEETTQAVTLANTYVKRFRAAHKRYDRLAKRATGTRRARLQRQAALAKKNYRTAVRARTKARAAHKKAESAVAAANCPA
ncbi:hypothetical protein OJ998_08360 [Solirubrobacter taibaiensis]|nr:hypothetical protein [Solirubrobacter taibaiensis]